MTTFALAALIWFGFFLFAWSLVAVGKRGGGR